MRIATAALLVVLCSPFAATAQEAGRLLAVQQRKFRLQHELDVGAMFEPVDAFSKGLGGEGAYVLHLNDEWSWEILRGGYAVRLDTGLQKQLERDFGVAPTAFEALKWWAASALDWAPVYGKFALRNASLVHAEALLTVGGIFGRFTSSYLAGPEIGVGVRVFLSQRLSVRFDARDALFINPGGSNKVKNLVFLTLSLSINMGGAD